MTSTGVLLASVVVVGWVALPATQPQPSIQGVWRNVERVIPASTNPETASIRSATYRSGRKRMCSRVF